MKILGSINKYCNIKYTLFFKKKQFYKNKRLILRKKLKTSQEQNQACCHTEHKNKVSRARHKNKLKCMYYFSPVIFDQFFKKNIGKK